MSKIVEALARLEAADKAREAARQASAEDPSQTETLPPNDATFLAGAEWMKYGVGLEPSKFRLLKMKGELKPVSAEITAATPQPDREPIPAPAPEPATPVEPPSTKDADPHTDVPASLAQLSARQPAPSAELSDIFGRTAATSGPGDTKTETPLDKPAHTTDEVVDIVTRQPPHRLTTAEQIPQDAEVDLHPQAGGKGLSKDKKHVNAEDQVFVSYFKEKGTATVASVSEQAETETPAESETRQPITEPAATTLTSHSPVVAQWLEEDRDESIYPEPEKYDGVSEDEKRALARAVLRGRGIQINEPETSLPASRAEILAPTTTPTPELTGSRLKNAILRHFRNRNTQTPDR